MVMGPDCGTAIIAGTPLAFANVVPRGDIGMIGASGTGIQEVSCLIARAGGGVSHAIGTGGRDLQAGGRRRHDPDGDRRARCRCRDPTHRADLEAAGSSIARSRCSIGWSQKPKPFTVCFLGAPSWRCRPMPVSPARSRQLPHLPSGQPVPAGRSRAADARRSAARARGLFAGGTFCAEAQVVFRHAGPEGRLECAGAGRVRYDRSG